MKHAALFIFILFAAVNLTTGCSTVASVRCSGFLSKNYVVPDLLTAEEQAARAQQQFEESLTIADEETRREELRKARSAFEKVIERFPDDRRYTPPSHLLKGDIQFELGHFTCAELTYRKTIRLYPDIPDVHASALLGLGQTVENQGHIRESKQYYSQIIDLYDDYDNSAIRSIVRQARIAYDDIE